ncbi:hypothetical protein TCON_0748 [Astathelohania contejeani]|uniref:Uncharacterized protein n=1 Tax=Astathelohania contejeani TaxID=164912 RepID=A0ABQ7I0T8_9MICR|nr:hypothetical protein TCON_0748 [Thelohania contejeani]
MIRLMISLSLIFSYRPSSTPPCLPSFVNECIFKEMDEFVDGLNCINKYYTYIINSKVLENLTEYRKSYIKEKYTTIKSSKHFIVKTCQSLEIIAAVLKNTRSYNITDADYTWQGYLKYIGNHVYNNSKIFCDSIENATETNSSLCFDLKIGIAKLKSSISHEDYIIMIGFILDVFVCENSNRLNLFIESYQKLYDELNEFLFNETLLKNYLHDISLI